MKKIRLGIYIEDSEYGDRLTCYFMNHYKDQLEIHMYTMKEQLEHLEGEIDIMLSSELDQWNNKHIPLIQIVEETPIESEEGIYFVEKYQEVNRIVEEILKHVGGEVRDLKSEGSLIGQTRLISVYALADNQYQMPFAMTLSSILSENEKVLLMDFQENSGLSRMLEQSVEHNLDELLVMAESGRYSTNRINSCIGRKHINPASASARAVPPQTSASYPHQSLFSSTFIWSPATHSTNLYWPVPTGACAQASSPASICFGLMISVAGCARLLMKAPNDCDK